MEQTIITNNYLFRTPPSPRDTSLVGSFTDKEEKKKQLESKQIVCRQCLHIITRPKEKIQVNGSHHHTFANPHGLIFEVGCFQTAEGCGYTGQASEEYTWFRGYLWRVAVCGKCLTQLGWLFSASMGSTHFHGLILDKLIFES